MTVANETAAATLTVEPATPTIGAYVVGVDLADLADAAWADVEAAFAEHSVLFFRDQDLSPDAQEALGRRLGELHVHPSAPSLPGHPNVMIIHADEHSRVVAGNGWHTDVSCDERPPRATILPLMTVPPSGGDTLFVSTTAAWDALSEAMRDFLRDKDAVHESAHIYAGRYGSKESDSRDGVYPSSVHPIARRHPVTGKTALYVNRAFTTRIKGLKPAESSAILQMLYTHLESVDFQVRFSWVPGSVSMWDGRVSQLYAGWEFCAFGRHGRRGSGVGDRPYR